MKWVVFILLAVTNVGEDWGYGAGGPINTGWEFSSFELCVAKAEDVASTWQRQPKPGPVFFFEKKLPSKEDVILCNLAARNSTPRLPAKCRAVFELLASATKMCESGPDGLRWTDEDVRETRPDLYAECARLYYFLEEGNPPMIPATKYDGDHQYDGKPNTSYDGSPLGLTHHRSEWKWREIDTHITCVPMAK